MDKKKNGPDKSDAARRKTFAPHDDPKAQPDGDPGVNKSTRDDDVAETAEEAADRAKLSD
jgi:hypothetical protein